VAVSCESAAHPVGTTVRVCDFLQYLPVRRKAALKASSKAISKIKTLLQAYAMARPAVRLSLRVLGGKSDSGWSYPAKQGSILADAVLLVAGADVASQCVTKTTALDDFGRIESRPDLADGWDANSQPMHISVMLPRSDSGMFPFSNGVAQIR
jgi:DNA mismatch repair ATPase MutL